MLFGNFEIHRIITSGDCTEQKALIPIKQILEISKQQGL